MKALTIHQPWAQLLVTGCKVYEYRSWDTRYRGLVAIHAATRLEKCEWQALDRPEVQKCLRGIDDLPIGAVIAIGRLADTRFLTERAARAIRRRYPCERIWGSPSRSQYAWEFDEIQELSQPVPAVGALGLWQWRIPRSARAEIDQISGTLLVP